jgi:hypothetical protein
VRTITVGRIAIGIVPPALALLLVGTSSVPLVVAFTLLMGASQGVITIVRVRFRSRCSAPRGVAPCLA